MEPVQSAANPPSRFAPGLAVCREMVVVHRDQEFLEDITGKLKEVRVWARVPPLGPCHGLPTPHHTHPLTRPLSRPFNRPPTSGLLLLAICHWP